MISAPSIPLSLYIHFPWCTQKCPYCDFNSHTLRTPLDELGYLTSLIEDATHQAIWAYDRPLNTIFLGGGTPSLFSVDTLNQLFAKLKTLFVFEKNIEITMECNPGSLTREYLSALSETPINRLSIGVQSFDTQQLKYLGRIHNPHQAHQAIQGALDAGFKRINIDLMHGLSHQTPQQACHDLEQALQYPLEHLSWYQLTIEPNTYFHHHPPPQPDHDMLFEIQQQGQALLRHEGFNSYEISAYEKNHQACLHNLNYWEFGDYLGIGAGAHGKITHPATHSIFRYWNVKHPKRYLQSQAPYQQSLKTLQPLQLPEEYMMNALRLKKPCSLTAFEQRTGLSRKNIDNTLKRLRKDQLIKPCEDGFLLTDLGERFTDDVVMAFLQSKKARIVEKSLLE